MTGLSFDAQPSGRNNEVVIWRRSLFFIIQFFFTRKNKIKETKRKDKLIFTTFQNYSNGSVVIQLFLKG